MMVTTVHVRVAWWLLWYLRGVSLMASMTGCRPDPIRVRWWIYRALTVEVKQGRHGSEAMTSIDAAPRP